MLLIAIDTSGRNGSAALCRGNHSSFETLQLTSLEGGTYSARLMPAIAEMLAQHKIVKEDIDGFVVVSGPGSFTGLRVGIATVKGLCEVLHKPLASVTMLEAIAIARGQAASKGHGFSHPESAQKPGASAAEKTALKGHGFSRAENGSFNAALAAEENVAIALDAGRGEIYIGDFTVAHSRATCLREYIAKLDGFAAEAASNQRAVLTPDAKVAEALSARGAAVRHVAAVHADEIGRIGLAKLLAGDTVDHATLDANYIRRSDAEIFAPKP
jgi:tRNA threonylcarbamoyladenosine biosynthesis protein TsaB